MARMSSSRRGHPAPRKVVRTVQRWTLLATLMLYGEALWAAPQRVMADTNSEAFTEEVCKQYAAQAGAADLVAAIDSGAVNVFEGYSADMLGNQRPLDMPAISTAPPGQPALIIVRATKDPEQMGAGALHEWVHIRDHHQAVPSSGELTDEELQTLACQECSAHCEVLAGMQFRFDEQGLKPPCSLRNLVMDAAGWECLRCQWGPGAMGPPAPDPCQGQDFSGLPCTP